MSALRRVRLQPYNKSKESAGSVPREAKADIFRYLRTIIAAGYSRPASVPLA